jgi:hypothetical protein
MFLSRIALFSAFLLVSLDAPALCAKEQKADAVVEKAANQPVSVVRVNVTSQPYDFLRPWSKRPPSQRRAVGAVLSGARVLTTAEQVANATYLELEKPDGGDKTPAKVEAVDYECNLAIVAPLDPKFLDGFKPLALVEPAIGDELAIWQLENNGAVLKTKAQFTTAEVAPYPVGEGALLVYRLASALQSRDSGFTLPVVKNGALAGMLLRFDSRTQTVDAVPTPIIRHFLAAAGQKSGYIGFPGAGVRFAALRDPQLRHYAGLTNGAGGIYVTHVHPGGPADQAGIHQGDVLMAVGDHAIDRDGNYLSEHYGKVSLAHLIACEHFDGDKVPFKLARQGKELTVEVKLAHADPAQSIIEPYTIDKAPRYYVLGGLVFQELSRQFLKEWGPECTKKAPERFLYFDQYQDELFQNDPRERIVIMSNVLPSPCTVGYEELNCLVVTKVNGVELKSLADMDAALAKPIDGFHRIQIQGHPGEIILDAKEAAAIEPALMRNYGLPAIKRL